MPTTTPGSFDPTEPAGDGGAMAEAAVSTPSIVLDYSPSDHGALRNRRLLLAVLSNIFIKPLALVISVITPPLFVRYLGGAEGYGLYELVGSIAVYLAMANLGMSMGLMNKLTDCYVSGNRELARRLLSTVIVA